MHYSFKSTPTWTFKGRPQTASTNMHPGPTDYTVNMPLHQSGSVSQITSKRQLYKTCQQSQPGPGAYESKSYILDGPKRTMSAKRTDYVKQTPGPQDYNTDTLKVKRKAPTFSMSAKCKSARQLEFANNEYKAALPVGYDSQALLNKKRGGVVFGSSDRKDLTETQKTPGPNNYNLSKSDMLVSGKKARCVMGKESRDKATDKRSSDTPGPAFYNKKSNFQDNKDKKRGFSCRNRNPDLIALEIAKMPGPGMYETPLKNKAKAAGYAPTSADRDTFVTSSKRPGVHPAPNAYNPSLKSSKYRSASVGQFRRSQRPPLDENQTTPGPAVYRNDKLSVMNSAPKFSVTKGTKNQFPITNAEGSGPAPNTYKPKVALIKEGSKQFSVGTDSRPNPEKLKYAPGPGYYRLKQDQRGPHWSFPINKRLAFTDENNEAKDGQHYEIEAKVVDPPKYMRVEPKIKYESPTKQYNNTMNTMNTMSRSNKRHQNE